MPPIKMAASLIRSNVESKRAPHLVLPRVDNLATVPSNKSNNAKKETAITPVRNLPLLNKMSAEIELPNPPTSEIQLGVMRIFIRTLAIGSIIFATGSRKPLCNINTIVGLVIMANLINARYLLGSHPQKKQIAEILGLTQGSDFPTEPAELVVVLASTVTGVDKKLTDTWQNFRENYVPTVIAVLDFENGEVDFEDMSAILGKMLEPVLTPYLVLHEDSGKPAALINLEDLSITDYSTQPVSTRDSDIEHKELVKDFADELKESLVEGGWEQFVQGLIIPAIPLLLEKQMGITQIKRFLDLVPSRS